MLAFLSDENFNGEILRGLFRRRPSLEIVRVQDVGLIAATDSRILEWAAAEGRIVLTHDRDTMPHHAYNRVNAGQPMPGVFLVDDQSGLGQVIDDILLAVDCLTSEECNNLVRFFPL